MECVRERGREKGRENADEYDTRLKTNTHVVPRRAGGTLRPDYIFIIFLFWQ